MLALEWHQRLTSLRECCVKCGLLLNLQYRKWSDETIWCDRRHHVVVVGSAVIGNLCPKGNVWCSVPVGLGMVPQVSKERCAIGDSSFPPYLSTSIPASFFHLQIEGMLESFQGELPSLSFKLQSWPPQELIAHLIHLKELSPCHRCHPACPHLALCGTWGCGPHAVYIDRKIKSLPLQVSPAWLWNRSWIGVHLSNSELTMWFPVLRNDFLCV